MGIANGVCQTILVRRSVSESTRAGKSSTAVGRLATSQIALRHAMLNEIAGYILYGVDRIRCHHYTRATIGLSTVGQTTDECTPVHVTCKVVASLARQEV